MAMLWATLNGKRQLIAFINRGDIDGFAVSEMITSDNQSFVNRTPLDEMERYRDEFGHSDPLGYRLDSDNAFMKQIGLRRICDYHGFPLDPPFVRRPSQRGKRGTIPARA